MSTNKEMEWLLQDKYRGEKTEAFANDCARLRAGEPLAYVIGWVPFLDTRIYLASLPLIPRVETEYWTEMAIADMKKTNTDNSFPLRVLDLCAGSGAIGVAVATALPHSQVSFAELDDTHLPTIKYNLHKNMGDSAVFAERFTILESDVFSDVTGSFDYILSNPPYIDPALDRTDVAVKTYEPARALYGGAGGLEIITRILANAADYLTPNGQLWIEHEPEQTSLLTEMAQRDGWYITSHLDQYHTVRYSVLRKAVPE